MFFQSNAVAGSGIKPPKRSVYDAQAAMKAFVVNVDSERCPGILGGLFQEYLVWTKTKFVSNLKRANITFWNPRTVSFYLLR